jgi:hypothetical protein
MATIDNFLRKQGYKFDNLEGFIYRMAFLENENFWLAIERVTYFALVSLKRLGWTIEQEKDHTLSYAIDWICNFFFPYTKETECLMYYTSETKEEEGVERIQNYRLEKYLDKHKHCLDSWNKVRLDKCHELFNSKFALVRYGKYKNHTITGEEHNDNGMTLCLWTNNIFVEEKQYKFTFESREKMENFIIENKVVFDSCLSDDFFLDEKSYISAFREQFDNQDLFERYYFFNPFTETMKEKMEKWW